MKILNELISTWISIAAFLISFSTLILAMRKQKHDERVFLASKIREIRSFQGETIRIIDEILEKGNSREDLIKRSLPKIESDAYAVILRKDREEWENLRSKVKVLYTRLDHKYLKAVDPVALSSIEVESEDMKKRLENAMRTVEGTTIHIEAIINKRLETEKPLSLKNRHKKPAKKQNVKKKRV